MLTLETVSVNGRNVNRAIAFSGKLIVKAPKKSYVEIEGRAYELRKSKYALNFSPVCVSDDMSGKMEGIPSVSTSCLNNPICLARMQQGDSICAHCFAETTLKRYKDCGKNCLSNTVLLTSSILPDNLLPHFPNVSIVRIESFGDVANVTQAINYANMCRVNPLVTFAWWTKNVSIVAAAFDQVGKPDNVILIESSPKVNNKIQPSSHYVDKVFTVYSKEYIIEHNIDINCGARCCATCRNCYRKDTGADVREQLK